MANYKLNYTGEQVNTAIGNALNDSGIYIHRVSITNNEMNVYSLLFINNSPNQITSINELPSYTNLIIGNYNYAETSTNKVYMISWYSINGDTLKVYYINASATQASIDKPISSINDNVTQL